MSARVKCIAVRGSTIVSAGSDGEVRVTELAAAVNGGESAASSEPQVAAQAATGARITSCAIAAVQ